MDLAAMRKRRRHRKPGSDGVLAEGEASFRITGEVLGALAGAEEPEAARGERA
jgi:hypothetical protein